ncbi:MAG: DUF4831 family protein [Bacteroidales bacterium]|nr:DUF4831 family protein [Bacteroidales bacterium]
MKKIIYLIIPFLLVACSSAEKTVVTNIQDLTQYPEGSSLYALPRTRIAVSLEAVSMRTLPGPYCEFAEEFLGIEGAPQEESIKWEISGAKVGVILEPDPEYYYCIASEDGNQLMDQLSKLRDEGYVMMPADLASIGDESVSATALTPNVHYTDLSVKPYLDDDEEATSKKTKARVPVDLPVIRAGDAGDSKREKAFEAASFIIKIRKRRFKLLAGQYEVVPEGKALEVSVRELNRLEEEYLSLFVGKTYTDTTSRNFYFTPGSNPDIERKELCRFSEKNGFEKGEGNGGRPVVLDMRELNYTSAFRQIMLPYHNPGYENTLLYRIPEKASIRILEGSAVIFKGEVPVYQYGVVVPLGIGGK